MTPVNTSARYSSQTYLQETHQRLILDTWVASLPVQCPGLDPAINTSSNTPTVHFVNMFEQDG